MTIVNNLWDVRRRIEGACAKAGRPASEVGLVAVTKEATVGQINEALVYGVRIIGENRVQDAIAKYRAIGNKAEWHLIGHLQTNKVRDAVKIFSLIHSVDSVRLAATIDKEAGRLGKVQDVLIEVNTSGETSKFGVTPDSLGRLFKEVVLYSNINIKGLMTMAPEAADPEFARPYFQRLRELRDKLYELRVASYELRTLSMGMTNDFEIAIEEGANLVRIGRAIFARG